MPNQPDYSKNTLPSLLVLALPMLREAAAMLPKSDAAKQWRTAAAALIEAANAKLLAQMETRASGQAAAQQGGKRGRPSRIYAVSDDTGDYVYGSVADAAAHVRKKPQSIHNAMSAGNGRAHFLITHPQHSGPMPAVIEYYEGEPPAQFDTPPAPQAIYRHGLAAALSKKRASSDT